MTAEQLIGATATTLLYMRDGSFFQNSGQTFVRTKLGGVWSPWVAQAQTNHSNLVNTGWVTVMSGVSSKRIGDVVYVNFNKIPLKTNTTLVRPFLLIGVLRAKSALPFNR